MGTKECRGELRGVRGWKNGVIYGLNKIRILLFLGNLKIQVSIDAEFLVVEIMGLGAPLPLGKQGNSCNPIKVTVGRHSQ